MGANDECFDAANEQEKEGNRTIHDADFFVVNSREPVNQDTLAVIRAHEAEITGLRFERVIVRGSGGGCVCERATHCSDLLEGLQVKGDFTDFVISK